MSARWWLLWLCALGVYPDDRDTPDLDPGKRSERLVWLLVP